MNTSTLRQLWSLIEETQTSILLNLSDSDLITYLLKQLENQKKLGAEEIDLVKNYLKSKTLLIKDLAHLRLVLPEETSVFRGYQ